MYRRVMTTEAGRPEEAAGPAATRSELGPAMPDCQHLDEDPEALEDPVHSGDARHQHDLHTHAPEQPS
jgi:hypothetical protein